MSTDTSTKDIYIKEIIEVIRSKIGDIKVNIKKQIDDDIDIMSGKVNSEDVNNAFEDFVKDFNHLNTLNKSSNFYDFRLDTDDFKSESTYNTTSEMKLNKDIIGFGKNREMISRFLIDHLIINFKGKKDDETSIRIENSPNINTNFRIIPKNQKPNLKSKQKKKTITDLLKSFKSSVIENLDNSKNDINSNLKKTLLDTSFEIDDYLKKYTNLVKKAYDNTIKIDKVYNYWRKYALEGFAIGNTIGADDSNYDDTLVFHIFNVYLIQRIINKIDFFEFMMLQRIMIYFNDIKIEFDGNEKNLGKLIRELPGNNIIDKYLKYFMNFVVLILYDLFFNKKNEYSIGNSDNINLYKLAYESYYIKSLLTKTSIGNNNLDNRVKYYNFMFKEGIAVGKKSGKTIPASESNQKFTKDKVDEYNKGLLYYLNMTAVLLLKDNNIKILYDGNTIKEELETTVSNSNKIELNDLLAKLNYRDSYKLSDMFLDFIINEYNLTNK